MTMHDTTPLPLDEEIERVAAEAMRIVLVHLDAGQAAEAATVCRAVLEMQPAHAQAHYQLGLLEWKANDLRAAAHHLSHALQAGLQDAACWLAYVEVLLDGTEAGAAREVLELARRNGVRGAAPGQLERLARRVARAERGAPTVDEIHAVVGALVEERIDEAEPEVRALVRDCPDHALGWKALGVIHHRRGQIGMALEAMSAAAQRDPDDTEILNNQGFLLRTLGRAQEAQTVLRRSLELRADNPEAHKNLGLVLFDMGRMAEAEASARAALALAPDNLAALNTIGVALQDQNRVLEAIEVYRRVLEREPHNHGVHSNMLFAMTQLEGMDAQALFRAHRGFGQWLEAQPQLPAAHANSRDPRRQLRIGFLSGDLRNHAVASFIEPVFERLAGRPGIALHVYHNHAVHDHVSERLHGHVAQWWVTTGMSDAALDARIREDGIDILIDLSGHTAYNRLPLMAGKPAPIQVSWIGYPGTTGLQAVDYYLTDRHILPPGRFDDQFTEKLVHLPMAASFQPEPDAPEVGPLPALANGHVTFGSFNRVSKIGRAVAAGWGRLLRALPDSTLLLAGLPADGGAEQLLGWLAEEGVDAARVRLHPRCGLREYLALHNRIDIVLDSFPYSGGTTTMHALWMGVPILTVAGATAAGRQTSCILEHLGLQQFIAVDAADLEHKGLAVCRDLDALAALRAGLRQRFRERWTGQPDVLADSLEDALRIMWRRWCEGLPAASFEVAARGG
jgi:predicted O-linked N-acetylglucosamine transferase (SPINDLY family)